MTDAQVTQVAVEHWFSVADAAGFSNAWVTQVAVEHWFSVDNVVDLSVAWVTQVAVEHWRSVVDYAPKLAMDNILVEQPVSETLALVYRWRSRQFYLPAPGSLGACQISLDEAVTIPPLTAAIAPPLNNGDPTLILPVGVNAIFNLFVGPDGENLVFTKVLDQERMIFRLPSGRKAFNWQFEVISRVAIHSVELASTMRELRTV